MDVLVDPGELAGRIAPPKVVAPPPKDAVELFHDDADGFLEPRARGRDLLDLGPDASHRSSRRPALAPVPSRPPRLHESVVEAQEVEAFGPLPQIHDPGLLRMQGEFQGRCCLLEPSQGCLRVRFGSTYSRTRPAPKMANRPGVTRTARAL